MQKKNFQRIFVVVFGLGLFFSAGFAFAAPDLVIEDYTLICKQRVSRSGYNYTYQVNVVNNGTDAQNVTASLSSTASATTVVDGSLTFGNVAASEVKTSDNTFTIHQDWTVAFDESLLKWDIEYVQIVGSEGGIVKGDEDVSVEIPPGALDEPVRVTVESIQESDLEIETPGVCQFLGCVKLDIGDATLKDNGDISILCPPDVPEGAEVYVAKVVEYAGAKKYRLQGVFLVGVDGGEFINGEYDPAFQGQAPGRTLKTGTYSYLTGQNIGWVEGVVTRQSGGSPVEGAVVSLRGGHWLDVTDSNGKFRLPAWAGNMVVVAFAELTAEHGKKHASMPSNGSTITVDIQISQSYGVWQEELNNGDFETDSLSPWTSVGAASVVQSLGPINPDEGNYMAKISSGAGAIGGSSSSIEQLFTVPAGATTLTLRYNFIAKEYPEFVDSLYNDVFIATLHTPDGSKEVAFEEVGSADFTPVSGIPCRLGDCTWGQTGWLTASLNVSQWAGRDDTLTLSVHDVGDTDYDLIVLIDNIQITEEYPAVETWDLLAVCKKGVNPSVKEWSSLKKISEEPQIFYMTQQTARLNWVQ